MADKLIYTDGRGVKTINPFDLDSRPEAWTTLGKPPDVKETDPRLVTTVYAALDARYKAASDVPFCIYPLNETGKDVEAIDDSDDWQNVIEFLPNPSAFFGLCELALAATGKAYYFRAMTRSAYTKSLKYWIPSSVTPHFDEKGVLTKFVRKTETKGDKDFRPEEVFHVWLPDENVEAGAPTVYPLRSALVSAGALQYINLFVRDYMQRGAVKAMILALDGNPPEDERKRIESWFNTFMRGARNMVWRAFNMKSVIPTIIGEGLEALKDLTMKDGLKQDILEALGVPASLLGSSFASREGNARKEDERHFYTKTIIPDMRLIQFQFNEQILKPMGYRLQFEPDRLEALQKDEAEKIDSLSKLLSAVGKGQIDPEKMKAAIEISGLVVSDEQMKALTKENPMPEPVLQPFGGAKPQGKPQQPPKGEPSKKEIALEKFKRKAMKRIGTVVEFTDEALPAEAVEEIRSQLGNCKSKAEVQAVFDGFEKEQDAAAIVQSIRLALQVYKPDESIAE